MVPLPSILLHLSNTLGSLHSRLEAEECDLCQSMPISCFYSSLFRTLERDPE